VAEGATIVTQKNNEDFLEKALNTPRTLLDDVLAKNPKKAKIETVAEKKVYSDGTRTVELYHVAPVPHSNGLLIAYIPKEKILFQGDFSVTPGQPANDHVKALVPILEKLNLDFDRYINVHTSPTPQTKADVWKSVGNKRVVAPHNIRVRRSAGFGTRKWSKPWAGGARWQTGSDPEHIGDRFIPSSQTSFRTEG
jgi:flavorubredoxin